MVENDISSSIYANLNIHMRATIIASKGTTQNYMNTPVTVTFYTVYYKDLLVIHTSDKSLATLYANKLNTLDNTLNTTE